jgi:predicted amidohydrolase
MTSLIPAVFRPLRLALIQLATTADKQANLQRARALVKEACTNGANVVVLPVLRFPTLPADLRNVSTALYTDTSPHLHVVRNTVFRKVCRNYRPSTGELQ